MTDKCEGKSCSMFNLAGSLRGKGIKTRFLNPHDSYWDIRLGVRTFGFHPASGQPGDTEWRLHYTPTPYSDIFRLLRLVKLDDADVFVDLGSGLGRAVFAASFLGARKAIGVEVVPSLHEQSVGNLQRSRISNQNIEFICANALDYKHQDSSVVFMFHPFGEETMRSVLDDLATAAGRSAGVELRIIYMNPVFDYVLEQSGWLEKMAVVPPVRRWFSNTRSYSISLWRSIAST